jgi:hypothetical protein
VLIVNMALILLIGNAHSCTERETLLDAFDILLGAKHRYNSEGS